MIIGQSDAADPTVGERSTPRRAAARATAPMATGVGPTWQDLYGSTVTLNDGSTVTANNAYIHRSIVDPNAKVVQGFSKGVMHQDFGSKLSDSQIQDFIAYIEALQ